MVVSTGLKLPEDDAKATTRAMEASACRDGQAPEHRCDLFRREPLPLRQKQDLAVARAQRRRACRTSACSESSAGSSEALAPASVSLS
jgi:hypothetical protein